MLVLIQMVRRSIGCGEKALLAHQRNHHQPPILKYANTLNTNTNTISDENTQDVDLRRAVVQLPQVLSAFFNKIGFFVG